MKRLLDNIPKILVQPIIRANYLALFSFIYKIHVVTKLSLRELSAINAYDLEKMHKNLNQGHVTDFSYLVHTSGSLKKEGFSIFNKI